MTEWAIIASVMAMAFTGFWGLPLNGEGDTGYLLMVRAFEDALSLLSMILAFP